MPTKDMALAAYRHLLRSTRIAFQGTPHHYPMPILTAYVKRWHFCTNGRPTCRSRSIRRKAFTVTRQ